MHDMVILLPMIFVFDPKKVLSQLEPKRRIFKEIVNKNNSTNFTLGSVNNNKIGFTKQIYCLWGRKYENKGVLEKRKHK